MSKATDGLEEQVKVVRRLETRIAELERELIDRDEKYFELVGKHDDRHAVMEEMSREADELRTERDRLRAALENLQQYSVVSGCTDDLQSIVGLSREEGAEIEACCDPEDCIPGAGASVIAETFLAWLKKKAAEALAKDVQK